MANTPNKDDLLTQVVAYLNSAELCHNVFVKNPKYTPYCEAQKKSTSATVPLTILKQYEALGPTAAEFLTPSYTKKARNTPG